MPLKPALFLTCMLTGVSALLFACSNANAFLPVAGPALPSAPILVAAAGHGNEVALGAEVFVDALAKEGIGFLGDKDMTMEERKAAFKKLLSSKFDMQTIGRFALGRYWQTATPEQRKEYMKLFQKMTVEVYSQRFSDYQGQSLEIRGSRPEGSGTDTLVNSVILQDNGPEVKVDWRIRHKNGTYKVVDVIVEGVSMAVTQRSDFSSVIQRGGGNLEVLLKHLRDG